MWVLKSVLTEKSVNLIASKVYTCGRKGADINVENDSSVSRKHCTIEITGNAQGLCIKDFSKYGTFYAKNISESADISSIDFTRLQGEVVLNSKDVVRIGVLKSLFRVSCTKIMVLHSKLDRAEKTELQQHVASLNGVVISNWSKDVTHLAMKEIVLNIKVTQALACNCPIVTCAYFRAFTEAIKVNSTAPLCKDYIPNIADEGLNKNECSFAQDKKRVTLFSGKTFVFLSKKQFTRLSNTCSLAGATTKLTQVSNLNLKMMPIKDTLVVCGAEAQDSMGDTLYGQLQEKMIEVGLRFIQEFEVGLALLYCSTEMYCNPKFDLPPDGTFTSSSLSQFNAQTIEMGKSLKADEMPCTSSSLVPETVDVDSTEVIEIPATNVEKRGPRKRHLDIEQESDAAPRKLAKTSSDEEGLFDLNLKSKKPKPAPKKKKAVEKIPIAENKSKPIVVEAPKEDVVNVVEESDDNMDDLPDSCIADDSLWTNTNTIEETNVSRAADTEKQPLADKASTTRNIKESPSTAKHLREPQIPVQDSITVVPPTPMEMEGIVKNSVKSEPIDDIQSSVSRSQPVDTQTSQHWVNSQDHHVKSETANLDPELPFKDLTKINYVSLVVKKQKNKQQLLPGDATGIKNFKKFRKVFPLYYNSGSQTNTAESVQPPKIIGGNDLYRHDNRIENDYVIDDWAFGQSQEESQQSQDSNPFRRLRR